MKRLTPSLLAIVAIATTGFCHLGVTPRSARAAMIPNAASSSASATGAIVPVSSNSQPTSRQPIHIASRLGFRFRVRASPYRRGGFARGASCPPATSLTAISPQLGSDGTTLGHQAAEYTVASARPTFFVYVPALPATTGQLTLQRPDLPLAQRVVHRVNFTYNGQAGIVGIQLPNDAPPLEVGVTYVWQVAIACEPGNFVDSLTTVGGVVERVPDTTGSSAERLSFYMNQGIWQDAVSLMAEAVYTDPSNRAIANDFSSLLESAGLGAIAHAPVTQIIQGE